MIRLYASSDRFCGVNHASAANGYNDIHIFFQCQFDAFLHV